MTADGPPASGSFPNAPPPPSLVGQTLDGRYRIIKLIGEGGMGEVYAAEHVHIDKKYAIKLLKPEIVSNAEAVTRFRQEARSSSSIGHRNIIAIEDFGQLGDGRIYMCMELLNGAALNDLIQQPMPADRLLNILIQTGHGLAAAHAKGIVHRDMKPENIFVTIDAQGQDVPKILDFGIAKVSGNDGGNHLTRTGTIFGTPFYMAPEQALGNPVDARTDIYAVGVIMYECFAGSLPFQGESFMGILTQHITTEPEPVAQRAAKAGRALPMGLAEIITRCMQKDPNQRFGSMDELVNALIAVYRGIAGPGMSTYMEAFPVGSAQHVMQPTPPPMQGFAPNAPQTGPHGMPSGSQPPRAGVMGAQSPPMGMAQASPSGMYDPAGSVVAPKKSKVGIIIAIVVLLAAGGGIAAVVLMGGDKKAGTGSGSEVASNDPGSNHGGTTGSDHGTTAGSDHGTTAGSDHGTTAGSDHGTTAGSDHGTTAGSDHGTTDGSDHSTTAGSDHGTTAGSDHVIDVGPKPVRVTVTTEPDVKFEIFESGQAIPNAFDDGVMVTPGTSRTVVIKAKGFKDQPAVLDGKTKRVAVRLQRVAGPGHPTNPIQPTGPDCSNNIVKPDDKHCVNQYCARHKDDARCDLM